MILEDYEIAELLARTYFLVHSLKCLIKSHDQMSFFNGLGIGTVMFDKLNMALRSPTSEGFTESLNEALIYTNMLTRTLKKMDSSEAVFLKMNSTLVSIQTNLTQVIEIMHGNRFEMKKSDR
ncbi:MAG: hypothetical protein K9G61_09975 [Bacteroidales bacterium]|nr:hypothetical protein [Bacteroidales bacterium]